MYFLIYLKAREKFVSLKKNTRGDIVAELEEVLALYFLYIIFSFLLILASEVLKLKQNLMLWFVLVSYLYMLVYKIYFFCIFISY